MTDGNLCSFCAMLAGRGPVYRSAEGAGTVTGHKLGGKDHAKIRRLEALGHTGVREQVLAGVRRPRKGRATKRDIGEKYHNFCGCTVEEVFEDWIPTADEKRFQDLYLQASGDSLDEILASMRRNGGVNDATSGAPKTQAGGGGGGGGRRLRPPLDGGFGPPEDEAEWEARRRALKSDLHGERIYPHEVVMLEQLEDMGHLVDWIPKSEDFSPSNDFTWLTLGGKRWEAKWTNAQYGSIKGQIADAVASARDHAKPVAKERFLVHLKGRPSQKLIRQLGLYNRRNPSNAIKELSLLFNGELISIELLQ